MKSKFRKPTLRMLGVMDSVVVLKNMSESFKIAYPKGSLIALREEQRVFVALSDIAPSQSILTADVIELATMVHDEGGIGDVGVGVVGIEGEGETEGTLVGKTITRP